MNSRKWIPTVTVLFAFSAATALAQSEAKTPAPSTKATAGDLEKVSADGKSITVKTAEGSEEKFKVTGNTTVDGSKGSSLAGKEGNHVVIHYTEKGAEKIATGVEDAGKGTWKVTEGTVTKIGEGGKDVTIKMKDGTEKTYHLSKKATIETGKGIEEAGKYSGEAGEKVVIYSTVDPTKEIVHLFRKL